MDGLDWLFPEEFFRKAKVLSQGPEPQPGHRVLRGTFKCRPGRGGHAQDAGKRFDGAVTDRPGLSNAKPVNRNRVSHGRPSPNVTRGSDAWRCVFRPSGFAPRPTRSNQVVEVVLYKRDARLHITARQCGECRDLRFRAGDQR